MHRKNIFAVLILFLPFCLKAQTEIRLYSGAALGGGFHWLSWEMEGTRIAEWLQKQGIAAFVLEYSLVDMGGNKRRVSEENTGIFPTDVKCKGVENLCQIPQ